MEEAQADPLVVGLEEVRREGLQILDCRTAAIDVEDGEQFGESCSFDLQLYRNSKGVLRPSWYLQRA
jgi:hypothetical protein